MSAGTPKHSSPSHKRTPVNDMVVVNTDGMQAPQPGEGLIATRQNKIIAKLGQNAHLVSIYLLGYNRLEKTKISLESILKFTAGIDYELVLIDNGSSDGTLEYFKSIDYAHKKIVHVTRNMGAFDPTWDHVSGRYIVGIPNDVYVTPNWLSNLLRCAMSDDRIGMVVPVSSNASNLQDPGLKFDSLEEMREKAAQFNVSDPHKWHDRLRLLNVVGLFKRESLDMIGKFDYGFFHDFTDDDITFRMRRAGYRTVLCKDTFVHHDHNYSTDKDPAIFSRSLESGRKDFINKYFGVDAWDDVNNYETFMMSLVVPEQYRNRTDVSILGVDVMCGTPILELKNKLREADVNNASLSAFSLDAKYWLDLKTICDGTVIVDRIDYLADHFMEERFDFILLGKPINTYSDSTRLIRRLRQFLKPGGHLLVKLRNTLDLTSLVITLGGKVDNFSAGLPQKHQVRLDDFIDQVSQLGLVHKNIALDFIPISEKDKNYLRELFIHARLQEDIEEVFTRAGVRDYIFDFVTK
jgi:GT2 family glycosyltransferase/SAM-dependent methyltransferase